MSPVRLQWKKLFDRGLCLLALLTAGAAVPALHAQDFRKQVIYQIITDRFFDGDPTNNNPPQSPGMYDPTKTNWQAYWGGDFAGIQDKLPYLKRLGITAIWISPAVDNINLPMTGPDGKPVPYLFAPYHGYINRDFMRVEEHFGSSLNDWKAFDSMTTASHADGIRIVLDFSPNDSNLVYTAEHGNLYDNGKLLATYDHDPQGMFHHNGMLTDINDAYELQYYDVYGLADLNQDNPTIDRYIKDSIHQFQDHGVDAVRLDAVRHITWGWSYSFANSVYTHKPSFMFGEWFMSGSHDKFYPDARKFANQSGMSLLDYPFALAIRDVFANGKGFSEIQQTLEREDRDFDHPLDLVTFVDNHDIPRLLSAKGTRHGLDEATALVLTARGIPVVYYGDEQYLHNDTDGGRDPYTRVWMSSYDTNSLGFRLVQQLAALRQSNDALAYGSMQMLHVEPDVFVFERHFANDVVLVAINKNETVSATVPALETSLPPGSYSDFLGGLMDGGRLRSRRFANGKSQSGPLVLAPHSVSVWQSARPANTAEVGSLGPTIGQPGMQITIAGQRFGSSPGSVLVGTVAAPVRSWSNDTVTFTIPSIPPGTYPVELHTAQGPATNQERLTVIGNQLIPITFTVNDIPLLPGASVYLTGNTVGTGQWQTDPNTASGPFLCPHAPSCFLDISVPAGKALEFKIFQIARDGSVHPEAGARHTWTVPDGGTGSVIVDWQR